MRSMLRTGLFLLLILAIHQQPAEAQSPYAGFDGCPCAYLGHKLPPQEYAEAIKLAALIEGRAEPYFLVDVRTEAEYQSGHIRSAMNIPVDRLSTALPTEDRAALIIVYCASGKRSAKAEDLLRGLGFTTVVDFGGIDRWPGSLEFSPSP